MSIMDNLPEVSHSDDAAEAKLNGFIRRALSDNESDLHRWANSVKERKSRRLYTYKTSGKTTNPKLPCRWEADSFMVGSKPIPVVHVPEPL
jgi:hypothetical protein